MPERRAEFLSGEGLSGEVRSDVVESWRRCQGYGVDPDALNFPIREIDVDAALSRAAFPVLDRLSERLSSTRTALVLASDSVEIAGRWGGDQAVLNELDHVLAVPGACMEERYAGTNGLGTTMELDRPVVISGAEHFAQKFQPFTCVGAPIHHPVTGRSIGVLDLVCRFADTNRLMMPLVLEAVEQIERGLADAVNSGERAMLRRYLTLRRSGRPDVVVLGEQLMLASPQASHLLGGAEPIDVWQQVSAVPPGRAVRAQLAIGEGAVVTCRVERLPDDDCGVAAAVIDVVQPVDEAVEGPVRLRTTRPVQGAADARGITGPGPAGAQRGSLPRPGPPTSILDSLWCKSRAWQEVLHSARRHHRFDLPVLVQGEVGTGKLTLLRAMWQASGRPGALDVIDAALVPVEGPAALLQRLRRSLACTRGLVVLRHADLLGDDIALAVAAVLDDALLAEEALEDAGLTHSPLRNPAVNDAASEGRTYGAVHCAGHVRSGMAVAATVTAARGESGVELPRPLADRLAVATVALPPLRARPEDISELVDQVMANAGLVRRWSSDALLLLARADWPGNVRQLANVVLSACHMRAAGDIGADDLPVALSSVSPRTLTPIEQAEKAAIVASLRSSGGNKLEAALRLGVSRSTLYRKLRAYSIDVRAGRQA
jgi:transcriptional regulator of acetoin/glycerol metabolism